MDKNEPINNHKNNRRVIFSILLTIVFVATILTILFSKTYAKRVINNPVEAKEPEATLLVDEEMIDINKETVIYIYTHSGEHYVATGAVEMLSEKDADETIVMSLTGTVESGENADNITTQDEALDHETESALTIYADDQIYGFYSTQPMTIEESDNQNIIKMYGYLEAYSDGSTHFSS